MVSWCTSFETIQLAHQCQKNHVCILCSGEAVILGCIKNMTIHTVSGTEDKQIYTPTYVIHQRLFTPYRLTSFVLRVDDLVSRVFAPGVARARPAKGPLDVDCGRGSR